MRKPLTWHPLDVERLPWREQVRGQADSADMVGGEVLATVVAWAGVDEDGGSQSWGSPAVVPPLM